MCGELVFCAEFRAILTPFSEVIRKPLLLLLKEWNCCFYCDSGLFLLRRKRFVE